MAEEQQPEQIETGDEEEQQVEMEEENTNTTHPTVPDSEELADDHEQEQESTPKEEVVEGGGKDDATGEQTAEADQNAAGSPTVGEQNPSVADNASEEVNEVEERSYTAVALPTEETSLEAEAPPREEVPVGESSEQGSQRSEHPVEEGGEEEEEMGMTGGEEQQGQEEEEGEEGGGGEGEEEEEGVGEEGEEEGTLAVDETETKSREQLSEFPAMDEQDLLDSESVEKLEQAVEAAGAEEEEEDEEEEGFEMEEHEAKKLQRKIVDHTPDELAPGDQGDQPDENVPEEVGKVFECRGIPTPPPLLVDGDDDLETPKEESTISSILNLVWSYGVNKNIPVISLTTDKAKKIFYVCSNVGIIYDCVDNKQLLLQGHSNAISCTCASYDKRWVVTADKGQNSMAIVWDSHSGVPLKTIFDIDIEGGCVAVALSHDSRYLATLSATADQILAIWEWTTDAETPICTAQLQQSFGRQTYLHFNPDNITQLVSNSDSQVIFYAWFGGKLEYYAPPLTDDDFNKPVGRFSETVFLRNCSRALTATSFGHMVVWDANKTVVLAEKQTTQDKRALKMVRIQERPITVLTVTDDFIVTGDVAGHIKFFDQALKLIHWYDDFHLGPINSITFTFFQDFDYSGKQGAKYPKDSSIRARPFVVRDLVVGTSTAVIANVTVEGTDVQIIHKEPDDAVNAIAVHPSEAIIAICSNSGMMKLWQYKKRILITMRTFDKGQRISCASYDPKGQFIAVGFTNGLLRLVDAISLEDCVKQPFNNTHHDSVTKVGFTLDADYLVTADSGYAVTIYKRRCRTLKGVEQDAYIYLGRYRGHYKPIRDMMFGTKLDSQQPRFLTLGEDRYLVEYDLEGSMPDDIRLFGSDRIEQSAIPLCMTWFPPITKESFILTANDQYKFKLYNATTKMCRKTFLGPTYGSPLQKLLLLPSDEPEAEPRFVAFMIDDKVGISMLPVTGNPHRASALIAHPQGITNIACSHDGKYLFTAGGQDCSVGMWRVNTPVLEAQARLGGSGLIPFFSLLDGGRDGELFHEMEDYFYYAQLKSQGINVQETRQVSETIPLSELPFVMRALGYYPSEQEVEEIINEVKFSQYVETGEYINDIDLANFIPLYVNHRPAFGLRPDAVRWAFEVLGNSEGAIERGQLLHLLQTRGEPMTEDELAEYISTLLGYGAEGGSCEPATLIDDSAAKKAIEERLPDTITADIFIESLLGFQRCGDVTIEGDQDVNATKALSTQVA